MQALLILLICLVALAILAGRYGVDSRDGLDWKPPDHARAAAASSERHTQPRGASDAAAHLPRHQDDRPPDPGRNPPWWRCRRPRRSHPPQPRRPPRPPRRAAGARRHGLDHAHAPRGVLGPALGVHRPSPTTTPWSFTDFHGRHTGPFMGLAPTSRSVTFPQVHILRFQNGLAIELGPSPTTWTWPASSAQLPRPPSPTMLTNPLRPQLLLDSAPLGFDEQLPLQVR